MNQELPDQIQAFLRGELTEKERKVFLQQIESDDQLAEQLRRQEQIFQTRTLTRRLFLPISIAAGIILIGIIWIVASQPTPTPLPVWAEAFAIPDPGLTGPSTEQFPAFEQAMSVYKAGNYADALTRFRQLPVGNISPDTLSYFIAQCHFGLGEWEACQTVLSQISPTSPQILNKIDWYAALSTLGIEEAKGIEMLHLIQAKEGHLFQNPAAELLEAKN